jgi:hypothetical protein|tara:strand:+ start:1578 stop:2276 length:699 start_codon:yes stop_codon:yes gene_type:complete
MEPVLVSAFVLMENHYQGLDFYIENGIKLLSNDMNKIVFIDKRVIHHFEKYQNDRTHILPISHTDNYLEKYLPRIQQITEGNPAKDTNRFYSIMCNKTEWIRKAIQTNLYDTPYYTWIDFGIYKILDENTDLDMLKKCYDTVRIGHIWDLKRVVNVNINKKICWYFAGGIFGGNKTSLLEFADIMKFETLRYINLHNALVWEVNIWYLIYKQHPHLFSPYSCNHNNSIVNHY